MVMQHATKYVSVDAIPNKRAISIEWPENIIGEFEKNIYIGTNEKNMKPLICIDILLSENQANGALVLSLEAMPLNPIIPIKL